ncbi:T-cell surface glycoprotein CD8 alpha chain isoform X1 [Dendrobates tinctorius]|uniref:T-cell surface glycoprotein CD8 alpha chain isoform X1 n=1 Tax=Dendrobates tinctorius TaxID=92724 RepID=UPI003CC9ED6D
MVSHTMLPITSLPILLCLFLCTHQLKLSGETLPPVGSKPIKLQCETEGSEDANVGVFWFRHKTGEKSPVSIVYVSSTSKPTYKEQNDKNRFKASVSGIQYKLEIEKFEATDQGTYYCLINKNSILHISPGLKVMYPEVTTPKPKSTKAPPARTTAGDSCNCPTGSIEDKETKPLALSCDLYVWLPLAGLCGFLLICLVITSIMLCCRTRKRRCRCKPRPTEEKNGIMNLPKRPL